MPTPAPPQPPPVRDQQLLRFLIAVCDQDRDEFPFGWSELPALHRDTSGESS